MTPDKSVTQAQCDRRHGQTRWILGGLGACGLLLLTTALGALKVGYDASGNFKGLDAKVESQQEDVREIRQDVKTLLRNGKGE